MDERDIFQRLFDVIDSRKKATSTTSYVAGLMAGGIGRINKKVMEEAGEVCSASAQDDDAHLVHELCDLLFHVFVLAAYRGIELTQICAELERRFGTSGLVEKAQRPSDSDA